MTIERGPKTTGYSVSRSDHNDVMKAIDRINVRLSRIEGGLILGGFLLTVSVAIVSIVAGHI